AVVVWADDRGLQPAENIIPVLRRATAKRYPELLAVLGAVSARLSTPTLTSLDAQVQLDGRAPRAVARNWLRAEDLVAARQEVPGATLPSLGGSRPARPTPRSARPTPRPFGGRGASAARPVRRRRCPGVSP